MINKVMADIAAFNADWERMEADKGIPNPDWENMDW